MPPGDEWCRFLDEEQVAALAGEENMERVRQVGDLTPDHGISPDCDVVLADGEEPVVVTSTTTTRVSGGHFVRRDLLRIDELVGGPTGLRLSSGEVIELGPGVYHQLGTSTVSVHQACWNDEPLPTLLGTTAWLIAGPAGRELTPEEIATLGERLAELTPWVHQCLGEVRPIGPEDLTPLEELAAAPSGDATGGP